MSHYYSNEHIENIVTRPVAQPASVSSTHAQPETGGAADARSLTASQRIDRILVKRVYDRCHQQIAKAVTTTTLPAGFLAGLVANESGGNPEASCFEPEIYRHLKAVASGKSAAFGSIIWKNLFPACQQHFDAGSPALQERVEALVPQHELARSITDFEEKALRELASSWGFTQIMGYQVIGHKAEVRDLLDPEFHFRFAVGLLSDFARRFQLRLSRDFEDLFRCWNTGRPDGKTFDPDYAAKGMRRMKLYEELVQVISQHPPAQVG